MNTEELIEDAADRAEEFVKKLSFEFYWDFAGVDKKLLNDAIERCFEQGYVDGYCKAKREK